MATKLLFSIGKISILHPIIFLQLLAAQLTPLSSKSVSFASFLKGPFLSEGPSFLCKEEKPNQTLLQSLNGTVPFGVENCSGLFWSLQSWPTTWPVLLERCWELMHSPVFQGGVCSPSLHLLEGGKGHPHTHPCPRREENSFPC